MFWRYLLVWLYRFVLMYQDELNNFKPFEAEFEYPLCFNDYKALRANKRGIIRINGKDTWIKEVKYKPNDLSTIKVKYKESMCSC